MPKGGGIRRITTVMKESKNNKLKDIVQSLRNNAAALIVKEEAKNAEDAEMADKDVAQASEKSKASRVIGSILSFGASLAEQAKGVVSDNKSFADSDVAKESKGSGWIVIGKSKYVSLKPMKSVEELISSQHQSASSKESKIGDTKAES
jgi:hypothetical protein